MCSVCTLIDNKNEPVSSREIRQLFLKYDLIKYNLIIRRNKLCFYFGKSESGVGNIVLVCAMSA